MSTAEYLRTPSRSLHRADLRQAARRRVPVATPPGRCWTWGSRCGPCAGATARRTLALASRRHPRRRRALIVQPDLFFISNERSHILTDRVRGAPDLVVEVLSPFPRIGKLGERVGWFPQYGVRECWLMHQLERRIEVLNFVGTIVRARVVRQRTPIRSRVLPEFDRSPESILRWSYPLTLPVHPRASNSGKDDPTSPQTVTIIIMSSGNRPMIINEEIRIEAASPQHDRRRADGRPDARSETRPHRGVHPHEHEAEAETEKDEPHDHARSTGGLLSAAIAAFMSSARSTPLRRTRRC